MRNNSDRTKFMKSRKYFKALFCLEGTTIKLFSVIVKEKINLNKALIDIDDCSTCDSRFEKSVKNKNNNNEKA